HFVVAIMGRTQVVGHVLGVVQVRDGRGEVMLPRQQDVLRAAREIGLVFLGQRRHRKRVPAEGVGIAVACLQLAADGGDPYKMQTRSDEREIPEGSVVESKGEVADYRMIVNQSNGKILTPFR